MLKMLDIMKPGHPEVSQVNHMRCRHGEAHKCFASSLRARVLRSTSNAHAATQTNKICAICTLIAAQSGVGILVLGVLGLWCASSSCRCFLSEVAQRESNANATIVRKHIN
jgi:hypothetical protein